MRKPDGTGLERECEQLLDEGFCIVPGALDAARTAFVRERLLAAADEYARLGGPTHVPVLDPNDRNVRVFALLELDPTFRELILHPLASALVRSLLGDFFMISNFTANIALPGSGSMPLHSDQALVAPEPWTAPWSMNVIWCLDDVYEANGATRYLPGSHRAATTRDLPADPVAATRAFEAPAGAAIAMDGRMWHTSGANVTREAERALLFAYYSADFIRPQVNWNVLLSDETRSGLDAELFYRLGLGPDANVRQAGTIFTLPFQRKEA